MRLICPNCGAQYEVDAGVIPETGRDVQCSNCANTWFQRHARQEAEIEERRQGDALQSGPEAAPAAADHGAPDQASPDETSSEPQPASQPEPDPQPAAENDATPDVSVASADADDQIAETQTAPDQTSEAQPPPDAPKKQTLDQGVADILRQEAERETSVRASETGGLETQPDLGLAAGPRETAKAEAADDGADSPPDHRDSTRGNLLPDIEEINSTLAAAPGAQGKDAQTRDQEIRRRSGFRRGFTYAILVFAVMALVYVFSAKIAETLPQTGPALAAYVDWINGLRSSVDAMMLRAVDKLTGLLAQLSSSN